jgi:hypothetical protein
MKNMKYIIGLFLVVMIGACSAPQVAKTTTVPGADLSKYKTFGFYEVKATGDTLPAFFNERVGYLKEAITNELTKKGYQKSAQPELLINIGIVVNEEIQTRETNWMTDGRYRYTGQRNYTWKAEEVEVGRYRNGTVTLHFVEASSNNMLWQGTVEKVIPDRKDKVVQVINEGMGKLFAGFSASSK